MGWTGNSCTAASGAGTALSWQTIPGLVEKRPVALNSRSIAAAVGYAADANHGPTVAGIVPLGDTIIPFALGAGPELPKVNSKELLFLSNHLFFDPRHSRQYKNTRTSRLTWGPGATFEQALGLGATCLATLFIKGGGTSQATTGPSEHKLAAPCSKNIYALDYIIIVMLWLAVRCWQQLLRPFQGHCRFG